MRRISEKEQTALIGQDGPTRYKYFVKQVVDSERAWGLWQGGWALAEDDDGNRTFPIWPHREYAESCSIEEWAGFEAEEIDLENLIEELLPQLEEDGMQIAVFPTPKGKGVTPKIGELLSSLTVEKEMYSDD